MMHALGYIADVLMVVGGTRLTVDLAGRIHDRIAERCAGSWLDHATRRIAAWVLR